MGKFYVGKWCFLVFTDEDGSNKSVTTRPEDVVIVNALGLRIQLMTTQCFIKDTKGYVVGYEDEYYSGRAYPITLGKHDCNKFA
jgi:hypothetical protein